MRDSSSSGGSTNSLTPAELNGCQPPSVSEALPRACFRPQPQSHPFADRRIPLGGSEAEKIGRSVAKSKPATENAIFDCKVLSRNHALVWFEDGHFWLKDTKSSNGTFVNNQRLGKGNEESAPRQLFSGDIVQFGVDVVENSKKVTHGCIVASVTLFDADGCEAKRPPASESVCSDDSAGPAPADAGQSPAAGGPGGAGAARRPDTVSQEQVHQLSQYLQEALHRERLLGAKLGRFRDLLESVGALGAGAWYAALNPERLAERLELLEAQLAEAVVGVDADADADADPLAVAVRACAQAEESLKRRLELCLAERGAAIHRLGELERCHRDSRDECEHLTAARDQAGERLRQLGEQLERDATLLGDQLAGERTRNDALTARVRELGDALTGQQQQRQQSPLPSQRRVLPPTTPESSRSEVGVQVDEAVTASAPARSREDMKAQLQLCKWQLRDQQATLDTSAASVDGLHRSLEAALGCINERESRLLALDAQKRQQLQQLRQERPEPLPFPPPPLPGSNGWRQRERQAAAVTWLVALLRHLSADAAALARAEGLLQPQLQSQPQTAAEAEAEAEAEKLRGSLEAEASSRRCLLADCDRLATRVAEVEREVQTGRNDYAGLVDSYRELRAASDKQLAACRSELRAAADRGHLAWAAGLLPLLLALLAAYAWLTA